MLYVFVTVVWNEKKTLKTSLKLMRNIRRRKIQPLSCQQLWSSSSKKVFWFICMYCQIHHFTHDIRALPYKRTWMLQKVVAWQYPYSAFCSEIFQWQSGCVQKKIESLSLFIEGSLLHFLHHLHIRLWKLIFSF